MGEVYVARAIGPESFQKLVALKRVLPHLGQEEEFVAMFLEEARLAASLDHPNIVQVIELGESRHGYFLTMEFVHGLDVRSLLRKAAKLGAIPLGCALSVAASVAAGLHYAHERTGPDGQPMGLVHRDVSPSNVLISYDGVIKLVDFGVAKAAAHTARTRATVLKGKVGYMSPEQCRGVPVDRRTDVFSLGVLLYELTTLHRPFYEDNHFAALNRIVKGDYERPSALVDGYPVGLEQIVKQALEPEPDHRYPSARAMLDDIESFAQAEGLRMTNAVLADYVVELFGRPPFPAYGPVPASSLTSGESTMVAPPPVPHLEPEARDSRGQMWLTVGLLATAMMSLATLVITLMREAPAARPPAAEPAAATPGAPEGAALGPPTEPSATPAGAGTPEASVGQEAEVSEDGSTEGAAPASNPSGRPRSTRRRRGGRNGGGRKTGDKPSKPKLDSIFPP